MYWKASDETGQTVFITAGWVTSTDYQTVKSGGKQFYRNWAKTIGPGKLYIECVKSGSSGEIPTV